MTREEYKANLLAYFLFNNIDLPEWASWIAVDYDREVIAFSNEPFMEPYGKHLCWSRKIKKGHRHGESEYFEYVDFYIDVETSLISVEELFDE